MLKDIEVRKIEPAQLPDLLWFVLKHKYHTEQWDFVVAFDGRNQIMYVDEKIPDEEIQKFARAASWPEGNINDPDCPIAETVNYIYETYGWNVWGIILDNHRFRYEKMETAEAQERAAELLPLIRGEIDAVIDGNAPDPFNEHLVSCVSDAGREKDRGRDMHHCVTGTDTKYVFYLGYLIGAGKIKANADIWNKREKWIPVEERLPDKPGDYWVAIRYLDGSVTTEKMFWRPDWPHEDAWREVVVAWQPYYCPEPYQSEN